MMQMNISAAQWSRFTQHVYVERIHFVYSQYKTEKVRFRPESQRRMLYFALNPLHGSTACTDHLVQTPPLDYS